MTMPSAPLEEARSVSCQEHTERIVELEGQLVEARRSIEALEEQLAGLGIRYRDAAAGLSANGQRAVDLEGALRALVSRLRRVGGYALTEDQLALWNAEWLLAPKDGT